jgi:hypothetical protein
MASSYKYFTKTKSFIIPPVHIPSSIFNPFQLSEAGGGACRIITTKKKKKKKKKMEDFMHLAGRLVMKIVRSPWREID